MYTALELSGMKLGSDRLLDVPLKHQGLYACQHAAEKIRDGQPQIDADIANKPLAQRGLKAVPARNGKGNRSENGKDNQKECP